MTLRYMTKLKIKLRVLQYYTAKAVNINIQVIFAATIGGKIGTAFAASVSNYLNGSKCFSCCAKGREVLSAQEKGEQSDHLPHPQG